MVINRKKIPVKAQTQNLVTSAKDRRPSKIDRRAVQHAIQLRLAKAHRVFHVSGITFMED